MVNSSVFKNMAELHEATLQSQSVQNPTQTSSARHIWNQLSYLRHLQTLNIIVQTKSSLAICRLSNILWCRTSSTVLTQKTRVIRYQWEEKNEEHPHSCFWCITISHSYETTTPLDAACKSLGPMISATEPFCKPVVSGRTSSWWFWWCIGSCGRCTWLPKAEAP